MTSTQDIPHLLTNLIVDKNFLELVKYCQQPNVFSIFGRTYTETWHSMMLAWLLDPAGSHNLQDKPLRLFIAAALKKFKTISDDSKRLWMQTLLSSNLVDALTKPNERDIGEHLFEDKTRPDVYVDIKTDSSALYKIAVEMKVHAKPDKEQLKSYSKSIINENPNAIVLKVFVAPSGSIRNFETPNDWVALDFQTIHDEILLNCVAEKNLDKRTSTLLEDYIFTLRHLHKASVVSKEEKELSLAIYRAHKDALSIMATHLRDTDTAACSENKQDSKFKILISETLVTGETGKEFFENILEVAAQKGALKNAKSLMGRTRYLLHKESQHPDGKEFMSPARNGNWAVETHASIEQNRKNAEKLLDHLGLSYTHLSTDVEFIEAIFKKYNNAFSSLAKALNAMNDKNIDKSIIPNPDLSKMLLIVLADHTEISGVSGRDLMEQLLLYLKEQKLFSKLKDKFEKDPQAFYGNSRYLINNTGDHEKGKSFKIDVSIDGWHIEAHASREGVVKNAVKILKLLDVDVSHTSTSQ